jgi:hypothetical protein
MKKKILVFLVAALVIGGFAGLYAYNEYNRKPIDTSMANPDYASTAITLLAEFQLNDTLAGKKYTDKLLQVDGTIKDIAKDDKGFYTISLGDSTAMSSVRCSMDSAFQQSANQYTKGQSIGIKGVCSGYNADELLGSDLILVRCTTTK